ncbi:DnaJ protein ERDJ3B [Citrus sinensis]|uniref:DnaJ protein ERDJ3B n=1 Tax=Citrus sinensis TaxID=2711 RepID=A0ACB8KI24_CITSI|nr:DnaJ protein ERDJ3B [Citrus sinensis]
MRELRRVMMLLLNWMQHWKIYTWEVWREKNVIKPAPGKRRCNCRNEVYHKQIGPPKKQIGPGMFQQMTEQEVVFCEDGEPIIDGEPGDLKFHIHIAPHDCFRREGNNLHATVTITLVKLSCGLWDVQAVVGFEKTIKHLDGHLVDISTKGITKPKEVRKFRGEGMPLHFSNKKGDLYITVEELYGVSPLTSSAESKDAFAVILSCFAFSRARRQFAFFFLPI